MAEKYRATRDDMKARIKEGRWEAGGGMSVEPDLNLLVGESIVRQLLVGTRYLKREYGSTVHVGWNPDTFGYTWQLPQIYKKSEIDSFVTRKMAWNETNRLPLKLFYWQLPDGSRVLTYSRTTTTTRCSRTSWRKTSIWREATSRAAPVSRSSTRTRSGITMSFTSWPRLRKRGRCMI